MFAIIVMIIEIPISLMFLNIVSSNENNAIKLNKDFFPNISNLRIPQWVPWTIMKEHQDGTITIGGPMGKLLEVFTQVMEFE